MLVLHQNVLLLDRLMWIHFHAWRVCNYVSDNIQLLVEQSLTLPSPYILHMYELILVCKWRRSVQWNLTYLRRNPRSFPVEIAMFERWEVLLDLFNPFFMFVYIWVVQKYMYYYETTPWRSFIVDVTLVPGVTVDLDIWLIVRRRWRQTRGSLSNTFPC